MKVGKAALFICGALLALGGAPVSEASSQTLATGPVIPQLVVGDDGACTTLAPASSSGCQSYGALEQLLKFGPDGQVEPNLATSVDEPNPTTYVIHLRPGVRFWDGNEITSADIVNALEYYRRAGSIGPTTTLRLSIL